jgi:hypothetical protein
VTAVEVLFLLLGIFALSFLATSVSVIHIPDSPADMEDPPDPYWP